MKPVLIFLFLNFLAAFSSAETVSPLQKSLQKLQSQIQPSIRPQIRIISKVLGEVSSSEQSPPLLPIRQARVKLTMTKSSLVKLPEGGFRVETEVVCIKHAESPVYDLRKGEGGLLYADPVHCASRYQGLDVKLEAIGILILARSAVHLDEADQELKFQSTLFFVTSKSDESKTQLPEAQGSFLQSRNIHQKEFILRMSGQQYVTCPSDDAKECQAVNPEAFSITYEIQD